MPEVYNHSKHPVELKIFKRAPGDTGYAEEVPGSSITIAREASKEIEDDVWHKMQLSDANKAIIHDFLTVRSREPASEPATAPEPVPERPNEGPPRRGPRGRR